ncbi:UNVERIFIED_CONTAM: hypothetical protein GTU68_010345 [Idotea baltica]|nr:hypothetical protein [Idotea baltica]
MAAIKIRAELGKVIIGKEDNINLLIIALLSGGHVLLEGAPGVAKTLMAKLLAKTVNADFSRIQFTPDLMPSDILGTSIFNMNKSEFEFKQGPIFSNLVLIDEINRSPAKTQAALFEVMEEKQISFDGKVYKMEEPFMVLATQNPIDHEGTYRLPEAQLDRFIFKIIIDYPTLEEETAIITRFNDFKNVIDWDSINSFLDKKQLADFRRGINDVQIEENLIKYIAEIVNTTRNSGDIFIGASPRASLSILIASKANAAISNRDFVTPEDIQFVASPVLNHRIILTAEKEMEGFTNADIVSNLIKNIEVPR